MIYDPLGIMGYCAPEYKNETPERATNVEARSEKKNPAKKGETRKPFIPTELPDAVPDKTGKIHSFSRSLAKDIQKKKGEKAHHGAHEAIVLKYLAHWSRGIKRSGGWFYRTLDEIEERYPYVDRTTIGDIVLRLETMKCLSIRRRANSEFRDRTLWYTVPQDYRNAAEEDLIYFDSLAAAEIGVPAAVVWYNFQYWSEQSLEAGGNGEVLMSPAKLSRILPFSLRTIERALAALRNTYLKEVSCKKSAFIRRDDENTPPNPDMCPPNPDNTPPNPDMTPPNPDTITSYKPISNQLENSSKEKPAASSFSLCEQKQNDAIPSSVTSDPLRGTDTTLEIGKLEISTPSESTPAHHSQRNTLDRLLVVTPDLKSLQLLNRTFAQGMGHTGVEPFIEHIMKFSAAFMETIPHETVFSWYEEEDQKLAFAQVVSRFQEFMDNLAKTSPIVFSPVFFLGTLECVAGGLLYHHVTGPNDFYRHGLADSSPHLLSEHTYRLHCDVAVICQEQGNLAMDQLTIDSRRAHASADTDKEENISLTPAHKTRIFRNGINERNQAGWYFWDREHYTSQIEMGAVGLKRIEKLFTLNPELTPAMLLQVVDKGTEEFKSRPMPRASEKELFDRFSSIKCVAYFACALSRLVVFYGLAAEFEGVTYLGEESEQEEVDTEHSVAA